MYCLTTWAAQWWEYLAPQVKGNWPIWIWSLFSITDYTVLFYSTTLLLYNDNNTNTNTWWLCMGLSLLGGIKIEKLSRPCEFNFQTLQSAYTIPTCGRNQKSSKSPPLNHNVPTVVETQFLYLFINLFWVISVNLFFPGKVWGLWAKFFSPLIRVSPTNTLTFSSSFYRFPPFSFSRANVRIELEPAWPWTWCPFQDNY